MDDLLGADDDQDPFGEFDPLAETAEPVLAKDDIGNQNHESDSDESIVELEIENCVLCGDSFEDKDNLITHLARQHFQNGLLQELLSKGEDLLK